MIKSQFILFLLFVLLEYGYSQSSIDKNQNLFKDSLEKELLNLKNEAFCDCYYKATKIAHAKISPPDGSSYVQISGLVASYCNDSHLKKIIDKWVVKKYLSYSENNNLYLMRCLDFYNSRDLKLYIDSVRQVELKKYKMKK
ncbi:MAG: hypothetical protein ACOYOT_12730 [Bacteroidales bacterium]